MVRHQHAPCVRKLDAPLALLHVLEKNEQPSFSDLTGAIGIDSREQLTQELVRIPAPERPVAPPARPNSSANPMISPSRCRNTARASALRASPLFSPACTRRLEHKQRPLNAANFSQRLCQTILFWVRLLPEDKAHFAELADVAGLSLSAWVLDAMREKAKRQGKKEGE
ncbi:hypothetical protein RF11_00937 [Thelohanellus kitauei]|uniref:Uncharacterized protein n=1 Tax=Thelohanellus kitauei TaxID=669202 RepID=A0A0C2JAJ0_THEKT|nr:hypothetical protein RF11_00937 [Thelohanellus kitauei]